jgi:hypothetical protein
MRPKKMSDKISDEVQCDMNNNLVNRSDIDRLEDAFVNALFKLEQAIVRIQQKFELQHLFPSYLWTEAHN